jgi:hypothetical protein
VLQLVGIALLVDRVSPASRGTGWIFAASAAAAGVAVVAVTVALGH